MNKKLVVSKLLNNVPILGNQSISVGQEFHNPNAFLGRLEYSNTVISYLNLKTLYLKNMIFLEISPKERAIINKDAHQIVYNKEEDHFEKLTLKVVTVQNTNPHFTTNDDIGNKLNEGDVIKIYLGDKKFSHLYTIDNIISTTTFNIKEKSVLKKKLIK